MEFYCQVFYVKEIIVDASSLDEGTWGIGGKFVHVGSKTGGNHYGDDLGNSMDETNRPKVGHLLGSIFFRQESNICEVEPMEVVDMESGELIYNG